ncbi:MAG: MarR family transcriptional regulator [Actinomycetota bacterium]|nr:MarR family transcriptional regulator [Actinomycetota bacterium]
MSPGQSKPALAEEAWRLLLGYFLAHRDRTAGIAAELGLTLGEMKALLSLDAGRAKPMRVLADDWNCDASNVTWVVDRLEERGVAERRGLPDDRRIKTVAITPAGEKTKAELLRRIYEPSDEVLDLSRADLVALIDVLRKVVPSTSASSSTTAPG